MLESIINLAFLVLFLLIIWSAIAEPDEVEFEEDDVCKD